MPSFRAGGYRFFFYSNDHDPPHVHVVIDGYEIRLLIQDGTPLDAYSNPSGSKIRKVGEVVAAHSEELQELWDEWFR